MSVTFPFRNPHGSQASATLDRQIQGGQRNESGVLTLTCSCATADGVRSTAYGLLICRQWIQRPLVLGCKLVVAHAKSLVKAIRVLGVVVAMHFVRRKEPIFVEGLRE